MAKNPLLKQQVLMANRGKIKIKKPKKWLYPMAAERSYQKQLVAINKIFYDKVREIIIPQLPHLVSQAKSLRPDSVDSRLDAAWVDQLKQLTDSTYIDYQSTVTPNKISNITSEQADKISLMNKEQFVKTIQSSLSVNPIMQEPYLETQLKVFQNQNVDLIGKLGSDQKERVQQTLYSNLSQGNGIEKIQQELEKSEGIGENRARLIARDQTNKFNGQLTQLRQQELGITSYVWTTAQDERVRPTHKVLDGEVFTWEKGPKIGHPGSEINCRCIAQPVITDAMFDGDQNIEVSSVPITNQENSDIKSSFNKIAYTEKFNKQEVSSMKEYQLGIVSQNSKVGGYEGINSYLRKGSIPEQVTNKFGTTKKEMDSIISNIDSTFNKSVVKSDFVVYRGLKNGDRVLNIEIGGVYEDKAYTSTSKNYAAAKKFSDGVGKNSIVMEINVKKGNEAIVMNDFSINSGHFKRENEILLPRGQKFKIISKTPIDRFITKVVMELI